MAQYRRGRINDEMQKELSAILRGVKDPRVSEAFITITAADVTPDLKYAKIYYSALRGDEKEVMKGLKAATGYMRRELARTMNLRITPELSFHKDDSVAYGAHIASLINGLTYADDSEQGSSDAGDKTDPIDSSSEK